MHRVQVMKQWTHGLGIGEVYSIRLELGEMRVVQHLFCKFTPLNT